MHEQATLAAHVIGRHAADPRFIVVDRDRALAITGDDGVAGIAEDRLELLGSFSVVVLEDLDRDGFVHLARGKGQCRGCEGNIVLPGRRRIVHQVHVNGDRVGRRLRQLHGNGNRRIALAAGSIPGQQQRLRRTGATFLERIEIERCRHGRLVGAVEHGHRSRLRHVETVVRAIHGIEGERIGTAAGHRQAELQHARIRVIDDVVALDPDLLQVLQRDR